MKLNRTHFFTNRFANEDLAKARTMRFAWKLATIWEAPDQLLRSLRNEMAFYGRSAVTAARLEASK